MDDTTIDRVRALMRDGRWRTASDVAVQLGIAAATARKHLHRLLAKEELVYQKAPCDIGMFRMEDA